MDKTVGSIENEQQVELELIFDPSTIEHLGVKMYKKFTPVIAEFVSNSYDADAEKVDIIINYQTNTVQIKDDGHGMTRSELRDEFLHVGRNRRVTSGGLSRTKKRKVTGKKGLDMLSPLQIM